MALLTAPGPGATLPVARLRDAVAGLAVEAGADLEGVPRRELLDLVDGVAEVLRCAEMMMAHVAAEVDRRSEAVDAHAGLVAREGCRTVREFLAKRTGVSLAQAQRWVDVGALVVHHRKDAQADVGPALEGVAGEGSSELALHVPGARGGGSTTPDGLPSGVLSGVPSGESEAVATGVSGVSAVPTVPEVERTPADEFYATLAQMTDQGLVSLDVAAMFRTAYGEVDPNERATQIFMRALNKAPGLAYHQVRKIVWQAQAFADPAALEAKEWRQHEMRFATLRNERDGMVMLTARLTPLAVAPIKAVLDASVRAAMRERRDQPDKDSRTADQMRADALTDMAKHTLGCDSSAPGVKTTVVVRMTLQELQERMRAAEPAAGAQGADRGRRSGIGSIDGIDQPVSVEALRRAAGDAQVIPAVLGGASEVLDWGRAKRLFTTPQRLALVERDGGCAWCHAPPSWCEAHHIRWWEDHGGPTDLSNGVLLCSRCHHRVHRDRWGIRVQDNRVIFTPPAIHREKPEEVLGGDARYSLRSSATETSLSTSEVAHGPP